MRKAVTLAAFFIYANYVNIIIKRRIMAEE